MKLRSLLGAAAVFALMSCGDDAGDGLRAITLVKVSGDSQDVALLGSSSPLIVQVLDTDGDTLPGAVVNFAVTFGVGTVTAVDTSDADGFVSAVYQATSTSGPRTVRARSGGNDLFFHLAVAAGSPATLAPFSGNEQGANVSSALPAPLGAKVADAWGNGVEGVPVIWKIVSGAGSLSDDTTLTDANGVATVNRTLGAGVGGQVVSATTPGIADTATFHATGKKAMAVAGGGGNVPERYTSDLWVTATNAYTGTWGSRAAVGNVTKVWSIGGGAPILIDSLIVANVTTISDNEVSADGTMLLATAEYGTASGLYIYSLTDPSHPTLLASEIVGGSGLHTGTFADIGGQRYVFAARDPGAPALMVYRIQPDSADKIVQVASLGQPVNYGIHDQYIRDGLAFVSDWNAGLRIYDVGNGMSAGTPALPILIGNIVTGTAGLSCNCVHNSWWYHDTAGSKRYLFVGQEGPGSVGSQSSGDIHVVDVSNMAAPEEVAFYHLNGAGVHNFWMDETRGILYAAYYNGGVVALDVTGTLTGNLASREIARIQPGGAGSNTYVWGVMLANNALWVSDMVSGFWKVNVP